MKKYQSKINNLKTNVMENIKYGNNYISGTVNPTKNGILQITTSYSDGWKVYIDGKEKEVIRVNKAFIGTIIEAGEHVVEFKYETPYLKIGIVYSILGLILYIIVMKVDNRRKNN